MIEVAQLLAGVHVLASGGLSRVARVGAVCGDSRRVAEGDVFVAVRGARSDGHAYVPALAGVAGLVVVEEPPAVDVPWVQVADARRALGQLAANAAGRPASLLDVLGVTGTNGKTTSTHIAAAALDGCGRTTGLLGTIRRRWPGVDEATEMTTPDPVELQAVLARMHAAGVDTAVMEVSSHALEQHRMEGVDLAVAAFTNLTQDHLDYHGTLEAYGEAKARLFTELLPRSPRARGAVINVDDPFGAALAGRVPRAAGRVLRTSRRSLSDGLVASGATADLGGVRATLAYDGQAAELRSPLVGWHNLENLLTAIGCGLLLDVPLLALTESAGRVTGVDGRLESVPGTAGYAVLVDYAHTPDALERVLSAVRAVTPGRVIVVFGCGGDRDRGKRPLMGRAAATGAHVAVVTSDNPRTEDPEAIVAETVAGVVGAGMGRFDGRGGYVSEVDRRAAIRAAIGMAARGDTVLVAGKGHEPYQDTGGRKVPFSDTAIAREAVADKGAA